MLPGQDNSEMEAKNSPFPLKDWLVNPSKCHSEYPHYLGCFYKSNTPAWFFQGNLISNHYHRCYLVESFDCSHTETYWPHLIALLLSEWTFTEYEVCCRFVKLELTEVRGEIIYEGYYCYELSSSWISPNSGS